MADAALKRILMRRAGELASAREAFVNAPRLCGIGGQGFLDDRMQSRIRDRGADRLVRPGRRADVGSFRPDRRQHLL